MVTIASLIFLEDQQLCSRSFDWLLGSNRVNCDDNIFLLQEMRCLCICIFVCIGTSRVPTISKAHTRRVVILSTYLSDTNPCVQIGSTALHHAAQQGHIELVDFLLKNGASVNMQNNVCAVFFCARNCLCLKLYSEYIYLCIKSYMCRNGKFGIYGCVFEVVTTHTTACVFASSTLNPICARSARWDQYFKTALQLAEANNNKGCAYLLKQVRE